MTILTKRKYSKSARIYVKPATKERLEHLVGILNYRNNKLLGDNIAVEITTDDVVMELIKRYEALV